MVTIENGPLIQAVQEHPEPKYKQAIFSGSTEPTFNKLIDGDISIRLEEAGKIADYYGFDIKVVFTKKAAEPAVT